MGKRERDLVAEHRRARISEWRAVMVRPAAEMKVVETLMERHGVHAYAPVETLWRTLRGRRVAYGRPVFRGFVFAQLPDDKAHLVHEVDGATRLFAVAGRIVRLDPRFIDKCRLLEARGMWDKTLTSDARKRLKVGQTVEVTDGPFSGFFAKVERLGVERRITVLVELFGRMTPVELEDEQVAEVKPARAA